jgi:hypothetical protein
MSMRDNVQLIGVCSASSSRQSANVAAEVPNVRVTIPPFAQSETSVVEQPPTQQDETAQVTDDLNMTNILLNTSVSVAEQVLAT